MKIKSTIMLVAILLVISCNNKSNLSQQKNKTANSPKEHPAMKNPSIEAQIASLRKSMTDYMKFAHPSYTEKDIEKCMQILTEYNIEMVNSKSKEDGMQIVKITVLKLNELNKNSGWELIETEEREAIAAIIIAVGHNKGYNSMDEDITEEWREW
jgi:hypothetical protein